MSTPLAPVASAPVSDAAIERASQGIVRTFLLSGLLFMLLPGTFLGVWNLIGISSARSLGSISPQWIQAHGQAQAFGWIGSFILGIGFYSLTKMGTLRSFPVRSGWLAWTLWTLGVALRWTGGVTAWHWRILLPASGVLELAAFLIFWRAVRSHRPSSPSTAPAHWMMPVVFGTVALFVSLAVQSFLLVRLAITSPVPALPHVLDQQLVVLAAWGVLVPTIWGFNARWLPIFAGFRAPKGRALIAACVLDALGIVAVFAQQLSIAAALFFLAAVVATDALRIAESAIHPAKTHGIHPSFSAFVRIAYVWLQLSCLLDALAVVADRNGGIWGASRHALTVGFIAGMVMVIGPRILPAFAGMRVLYSTRLMLLSLLLLHVGCAMRVLLEPLAYEHIWAPAWHLLPISACIELAAVTVFAINMVATLASKPAHLARA